MVSYLILGLHPNDFGLVIDFTKKRAIVRANTRWIQGIALELIPEGENGYAPGMVLIHRNWKNLYFMMEHKGWTDDEYFNEADKYLKELGLENP